MTQFVVIILHFPSSNWPTHLQFILPASRLHSDSVEERIVYDLNQIDLMGLYYWLLFNHLTSYRQAGLQYLHRSTFLVLTINRLYLKVFFFLSPKIPFYIHLKNFFFLFNIHKKCWTFSCLIISYFDTSLLSFPIYCYIVRFSIHLIFIIS